LLSSSSLILGKVSFEDTAVWEKGKLFIRYCFHHYDDHSHNYFHRRHHHHFNSDVYSKLKMPDHSYELQIRRWLEDDGKTIVSVSHWMDGWMMNIRI
jgi:hypothetical protein